MSYFFVYISKNNYHNNTYFREEDILMNDKKFNSVEEFMEYYGLIEIPDDDDVITESLGTTIGRISRSVSDWSEIKKTWGKIVNRFTKKTVEKNLNKKDADTVVKTYKGMLDSKGYRDYKKKFDSICRLMGIPSGNTTIESIQIGPVEGQKDMRKIRIKYSSGRKRVIIPNGLRLTHTSNNPNVKELKPAFKGKGGSKICFSTPRCYFKLNKETPTPSSSGGQIKYTPKTNFQTAYIDSFTTNPVGGVVYIDSAFPIQLVKFSDKMKEVYKESYDDCLDSKLFCYEKFNESEINKDELDTLIERIDETADIIRDSEVEVLQESMRRGDKIQQKEDMKALKGFWNRTAFKTIIPKRYDTVSMPDDKFFAVKEAFEGMRKENTTMSEYMRNFMVVSKICNIPPHECIIRKYTLKRGKNDKNTVHIEFANAGTKLTIPSGCKLYHKSPIGNLPYLQPQFRGRSAKGHLYSSPRVYASIHRDMGKSHADIVKGDHAYTYQIDENIKYVYVDPLVPFHMTGAIYISTNHPIKIKRLDKVIAENQKKSSVKESTDDMIIDGPSFASLEEFMEYYGLEYADDDEYAMESFKGRICSAQQRTSDLMAVKREWNKAAKKFKHIEKSKKISIVERKQLNDMFEIMKNTDQFSEYKPNFDNVCKFFGLKPAHVIIEHLFIGKDVAKIRYSEGVQKVTIPSGTRLVHVSPSNNISELKPSFKSKTKGKYMYSSNRCFFTLAKDIPAKKAGLEGQSLTRYTPVETIKTAYIDQSYTSYKLGAVYVDSNYPIKVKKFTTENFKQRSVNENALDMKMKIYESESFSDITEDERKELIRKINDKYI